MPTGSIVDYANAIGRPNSFRQFYLEIAKGTFERNNPKAKLIPKKGFTIKWDKSLEKKNK